jgi:DNA-binding MarR family transcriptional regulator
MDRPIKSSTNIIEQAVESFWESYPPFWRRVRGHIRGVAVSQFNITVEQFHMLRHIRRGLGSVSKLAVEQNSSRPAVSQAVDVLVVRGLVTRTQDTRDRRHVHLDLTPDGNTLLDAVFDDTRRWMKTLFTGLTDVELHTIIDTMYIFKKVLPT